MSVRKMVGLVVATVVVATAPAAALASTPAPPSQDPFYSYSGSLTQFAPGAVLRSRTVTIGENGGATPITATQVLYRTTGQLDQPTATVATIIRPATAGVAPTKLVAYQTAYDALGSECDPSYTLHGGNPGYSTAADEEQIILQYVQDGYTVVVADYEGEQLDWAAGQESGMDTLDAIRAAEHQLGLPATTPVGMVGYSGGSIATDMAAELAPTYAPELNIVGAAFGGVPADYFHNLTYINGDTDWAGVIPAVLVSLSRAYDISFDQYLSSYGLQVTSQVQDECINSFAGNYPGLTIQQLLKPQYQDYLKLYDLVAIGDHMIMSDTGTPKGPLYIGVGDQDGTGDGIMVTADDEGLAHTYCERGVSVQFNVYAGQDHTDAAVPFEAGALAFLTARLNGAPVPDGCALIGTGNALTPVPLPSSVGVSVAGAGGGSSTTGTSGKGLTLSLGSGRACVRGLEVRLSSATGPLTHVEVTLMRGTKRIAQARVARLTSTRRTVTLKDRGRVPPAGRYTLEVTQGGLTLMTRTVTVRGASACGRAAPSFTG